LKSFLKTILTAFFLISINSIYSQKTRGDISAIDTLLDDSLWIRRDIYDATHFLMIPLHYSFKTPRKTEPFRNFFEKFLDDKKVYFENPNSLHRLQFCYLVSQYLKLKTQYGNQELSKLEDDLLSFLIDEIDYFWLQKTTRSWKDNDVSKYVFKGMEEKISWKLNSKELDKTYYNKAIVDDEKFLLGVAADLRFIIKSRNLNVNKQTNQQLKLIEITTLKIFKERTSVDSGGFIFQKGFWSRHRDYRFAGCQTLACLEKGVNRKENISEDTSHSLRLPLLLESLKDGASKHKHKAYYRTLKRNLLNQFLKRVVKQNHYSKCFYLTNYLDGTNGYYRYGYSTHKNTGYGPYELSETFKLGWWVFLNDIRINNLYEQVSINLKSQEPCEYSFKDKTTRNRNPIIDKRFDNNLYIQITKMASEI
jgi:hypothetical protein